MARTAAGAALFAVAALGLAPAASANSFTVLYTFQGGSDGLAPQAPILVDGGDLYGTAMNGGEHGEGVFFKLTPRAKTPWPEAALWPFPNRKNDGKLPSGALAIDKFGYVYVAAEEGGSKNCGTVVQFIPDKTRTHWSEHVIVDLQGGAHDGCGPQGGVTLDPVSGMLYATTYNGAATSTSNPGTVIQLYPTNKARTIWQHRVIYALRNNAASGGFPDAPLTLDAKTGALFGTTTGGGAHNRGTAFELVPNKARTLWRPYIYSFTGGAVDGSAPLGGLLLDKSGVLFTATAYDGKHGDGAVVGLIPPAKPGQAWKFQSAVSLSGAPHDGSRAYAAPSEDPKTGLVYLTQHGGVHDKGAILRVNLNAARRIVSTTLLYSFTGLKDAEEPEASMTYSDGLFYGTAFGYDPPENYGAVFAFKP